MGVGGRGLWGRNNEYRDRGKVRDSVENSGYVSCAYGMAWRSSCTISIADSS